MGAVGFSRIFPDLRQSKCHGRSSPANKCRIVLPSKEFLSYSAEKIRDMIMDKNPERKIRMCDCIITDKPLNRISLVELKYRKGDRPHLIEHVRDQLRGGVIILGRILKRTNKQKVCLQAVLLTRGEIENRSEQKLLEKPLETTYCSIPIQRMNCGSTLPDKYQDVIVPDCQPDAID